MRAEHWGSTWQWSCFISRRAKEADHEGSPCRDESGLTLVGILVAVGIVMIGLLAIMQSFPVGTQGVETGRRQSTAVFLAN